MWPCTYPEFVASPASSGFPTTTLFDGIWKYAAIFECCHSSTIRCHALTGDNKVLRGARQHPAQVREVTGA